MKIWSLEAERRAEGASLALFYKSHGKPLVDGLRFLRRVTFINRRGMRWRDTLGEYRPHKTLLNRRKWWRDKDIFAGMMIGQRRIAAKKRRP